MSSKKHRNDPAILDKPYEENEIGMRGIFGFAIGLFLMIVVTFALMWALLNVMKDNAKKEDDQARNPMAMTDKEHLPPEPRLQLAPGFGVESEKGWVNMELQAPGDEYAELRRQWEEIWKNGRKDEKTGMTTIMPIEMAKQKFLAQNVKARSGPETEEFFKNARSYISDSSAGRLASEKRR